MIENLIIVEFVLLLSMVNVSLFILIIKRLYFVIVFMRKSRLFTVS